MKMCNSLAESPAPRETVASGPRDFTDIAMDGGLEALHAGLTLPYRLCYLLVDMTAVVRFSFPSFIHCRVDQQRLLPGIVGRIATPAWCPRAGRAGPPMLADDLGHHRPCMQAAADERRRAWRRRVCCIRARGGGGAGAEDGGSARRAGHQALSGRMATGAPQI